MRAVTLSDQQEGTEVNSAQSIGWTPLSGITEGLSRTPETLSLVAGVSGPGRLSGPARSAGIGLPFMLLWTLNMRPQCFSKHRGRQG